MMAAKKTGRQKTDANSLRRRAEELLGAKASEKPTMPTADVQALVHELNVHQMELEIQNEDLRQAQLELARSRDRYAALYDFAPVGYVTLDLDTTIVQANLTAARMLSVDRQKLIGTPLSRFMAPDQADRLFLQLQQTTQSTRAGSISTEKTACNLTCILKAWASPFAKESRFKSRPP